MSKVDQRRGRGGGHVYRITSLYSCTVYLGTAVRLMSHVYRCTRLPIKDRYSLRPSVSQLSPVGAMRLHPLCRLARSVQHWELHSDFAPPRSAPERPSKGVPEHWLAESLWRRCLGSAPPVMSAGMDARRAVGGSRTSRDRGAGEAPWTLL